MTVRPACLACGWVGHPARAVSHFRPEGPAGYRATYGLSAPLRDTRAKAENDQCAWQAERRGTR